MLTPIVILSVAKNLYTSLCYTDFSPLVQHTSSLHFFSFRRVVEGLPEK